LTRVLKEIKKGTKQKYCFVPSGGAGGSIYKRPPTNELDQNKANVAHSMSSLVSQNSSKLDFVTLNRPYHFVLIIVVEQRKPVSNNLRQEIELLANCYREITSSIPNPKTDIK
jgi:hypothetical protein